MDILLIEGSSKNADQIKKALNKSNYHLRSAAGTAEALQIALMSNYQMILMDLEPPLDSNLDFVSELRAQGVMTPVLILCPQNGIENVLPLMADPKNDFMLKPASLIELRIRIQSLYQRNNESLEEARIQTADLILDLKTREAFREAEKINLQNNEFELLEFLMRNSGRVITKAQILKKIWDYNFDPQTNVVDVLVWRLREKIDKRFSNKLIQTVRGVGYIFRTA